MSTVLPVQRYAAFATGEVGGNPAGVVIVDHLPADEAMQRTAAEVGYSETAFAAPLADGRWRVRYFSPESEVPFCGHATIALGAALARRFGDGDYALQLNDAAISVHGRRSGERWQASLRSPRTRSAPAPAALVEAALSLFGMQPSQLDPRLPPARVHAGADHLVLPLGAREDLAAMHYALDAGRLLMRAHGLVTIALLFVESPTRLHVRNAFASGGVLEDPATGAAAAGIAGWLRDLGWPHGGRLQLQQGDDMGQPSRIEVRLDDVRGAPVEVSGEVRTLD